MEQLSNRDQMYSTENSIQYSVTIYGSKESEREWMCMHMYNRVTVVQQKLSQTCKLNILQ